MGPKTEVCCCRQALCASIRHLPVSTRMLPHLGRGNQLAGSSNKLEASHQLIRQYLYLYLWPEQTTKFSPVQNISRPVLKNRLQQWSAPSEGPWSPTELM